MVFELGTFQVKHVVLADSTYLKDQVLYINPKELTNLIKEDSRVEGVRIDVVKPGENTRIVHLRDTVEPRLKVEGAGCIFPGIMGSTTAVGEGITHRLSGISVMESAQLPRTKDIRMGSASDSFLDMTGPGALSPFIDLINVVVSLDMNADLTDNEFENSVQRVGLKTADYLAKTTKHLTPDIRERFDLDQRNPALPNVVYVNQVHGVGRGAPLGVDFYGLRIGEILPTLVNPTEFLDGALVSDGFGGGAVKASTWADQNNPVILDLLRRHGKEINFVGVILMRIRFTSHPEKELVAAQAANLARQLGAQGAILTWPSAGNMFIETMLTAQKCEDRGIKTVLMTYEHGGKTGDEPPLLFMTPGVDAIVSTGSLDRPISLPKVERVVGGSEVFINPEAGVSPTQAKDRMDLDWYLPMYCTVDHLGFTRQSCIDY